VTCVSGCEDLNGDPSDGCEYKCRRTNGGIETCDGSDNDCDGIVDDGFDLASDVNNCGGCGHKCSYRNGAGVCSGGSCYLLGCSDGFADLDKNPDNGCECTKTNGGIEICDGLDNDCDGVIDHVLGAPGYVSVCECTDVKLTPTSAQMDQDLGHIACTTSLCDLGTDGATPRMTFCCSNNGAWSQCRFPEVDLSRFDSDGAAKGVVEVKVELMDNAPGLALELWYGDYPKRKKLQILTGKEVPAVGPGLITKYFVPEDAECPAYLQTDLSDPAFANFPPVCTVPARPWQCQLGKWAELSPQCAFDYSKSLVYLTAGNCAATVSSSVRIVALRYYPDLSGCRCADGVGCNTGRGCDMSAGLPGPWCAATSSRCAGICTE
jgi:hypothetical protein